MSNKVWPGVSKERPCPICGKDHGLCRFGDYSILCHREPSDHPSKDGGWYHAYGGKNPKPFLPPKRDVAEPLVNGSQLMEIYAEETSNEMVESLALNLGVSRSSLDLLFACYAKNHKAWAFPMRDGLGNIIGIRLRNEDGEKWAVRGSRQGLFIPTYFEGDMSTCYVTEGPTDCAAVLTLGLYSIGRPSCNSNHEQLSIALKERKIRRVVIISDNDDKRRPDGRQWNPGLDGAKALGAALKLPYVIWIPPTKDVREFVRSGGTLAVIESAVKQKVWKR